MRGFWYGMFAINIFMFVIVMENFGAGVVGWGLPVLNLSSAALCLVAAEQFGKKKEDK